MSNGYHEFLCAKTHEGADQGFEPSWMPDLLFPFQRSLVEWAQRKGRAAIFADCGSGKSMIQAEAELPNLFGVEVAQEDPG